MIADTLTKRISSAVFLLLVTILSLVSAPSGADDTYGLPEDPLVATVFETKIHTRDFQEMKYVILQKLLTRYAEVQGIVVTANEVDTYLARKQRFLEADKQRRETRRTEISAQLQSEAVVGEQKVALEKELEVLNSLAEAERENDTEETPEVRAFSEQIAQAFVRQWKVNRALYLQYGGRIIYQQGGPEPLDAFRKFLEEQSAMGSFKILDPAFEEEFWRYYKTDAIHDFYPPGSAEETQAFEQLFPEEDFSR